MAVTLISDYATLSSPAINTTGQTNSFVEVDVAQEHLNYWIKVSHVYNAGTE